MTTTTDRLQSAHEELTAAVEALVSGDDWTAMLDVAGRFHSYSPNNCILILTQRPDAAHVAGSRQWQALGRQVRKGEHGIRILAPCTYKRDTDTDSAPTDEPARVLRGFKIATVFDISQTDGDPTRPHRRNPAPRRRSARPRPSGLR